MIVQRGDTFTLFTSFGNYLTCDYETRWRSSKHPWVWPATGNTLAFPSSPTTCGTGDADVVPGIPPGSWRIFFSAHYPTSSDSFQMYVGVVDWTNQVPKVTSLLTEGG